MACLLHSEERMRRTRGLSSRTVALLSGLALVLACDSRPPVAKDAGSSDAAANDAVSDASPTMDAVIDGQDGAASDGGATTDAASAMCSSSDGVVDVCGCGCCGGGPMNARCYYPQLGQSPTQIPNPMPDANACATVGCSAGLRHMCCADPGTPASGSATYCARDLATDLERYTVTKKDGATCAGFALQGLTSPTDFPITTSSQLWVGQGTRGACDGSTPVMQAIGGLGQISFAPTQAGSAFDVHVTIFYADPSTGAPIAERFDVDELAVAALCP